MASYQTTSRQLLLSAFFVFVTVCLFRDGAAFDKILGLGLLLPVSCLVVSISGMLLGRLGMLLATTITFLWMMAVLLG